MQEQTDVRPTRRIRVELVGRSIGPFPGAAERRAAWERLDEIVGGPYLDVMEREGIDFNDAAYGDMRPAEVIAVGNEGYRGVEAIHIAAERRRAAEAPKRSVRPRVAVTATRGPRFRNRESSSRRTAPRSGSSGSRDEPEPDAAPERRCQAPACDQPLVGKRTDARTCSPACRKALSRLESPQCAVPWYEPLILQEVAAGRIDFELALDWMTDPRGKRDSFTERQRSGVAA